MTIYDLMRDRIAATSTSVMSAELVIPIPAFLDNTWLSEKPYRAVAIYRTSSSGAPVAWIELLSPSNKGYHDDAQTYLNKRQDIVDSGIVVQKAFLRTT